jgi:hypothetical protein
MGDGQISRFLGSLCAVLLSVVAATTVLSGQALAQGEAVASGRAGVHEGVASCGGSTCHGRPVASGVTVRQNELITWQNPSSVAGDHSRSYRALTGARGQAIAAKMGLGRAETAPACLGCHADPAPAGRRGARFQLSDGVGCEGCHGGSGGWIASHYALGASHADNVAHGMRALENPATRASVCLDCHFGSKAPGQFVSHQMMAAGHPRVSFELDLFTSLQKHHDVDADYIKRKGFAGGVKTWAVGQALALDRALTLFGDPRTSPGGVFPEFYFFDCHSCHRQISDDPGARPRAVPNPGRPTPVGTPPFNDENMIMLSAAAKVAAPGLASRFEADSRSFHAALASDRAGAVRAASQLAGSSRALASAFAGRSFGRSETLSILDAVLSGDGGRRYTDYEGGVQAVMAADTLLNALVAEGQADRGAVARIRPDLDRAYAAVRDPNAFRPDEFRQSMQRIALAARGLR